MRTQQVWRSRPEYDVLSENGKGPGARGLKGHGQRFIYFNV